MTRKFLTIIFILTIAYFVYKKHFASDRVAFYGKISQEAQDTANLANFIKNHHKLFK